VARALAAEILASQTAKLGFHERHEPLERVLAAVAPGNEELRDLESRAARQGRG
jgi:hypothetical protein